METNNETKNILNDDDIIKTSEGLIFNPYNSLNIKITLQGISKINLFSKSSFLK